MTHICVSKLIIIGSDNGLSPGRRQAIIWTNTGILLNGPLGTNFSEILIGIQTFSFKKMRLNVSSAKWRPFRLGLNVLKLCLIRSALWWGCLKPRSINSLFGILHKNLSDPLNCIIYTQAVSVWWQLSFFDACWNERYKVTDNNG